MMLTDAFPFWGYLLFAVSLGIACFPNQGETTEELLTAAARNMQRDKHSRKNLHNLSALPTPARIDHYT